MRAFAISSAANITDPLAAHGHGGVTKKKITFDESRLVKQKFKTAPATQVCVCVGGGWGERGMRS